MSQYLLVAIVYVMAAPVIAGSVVIALLTMPGYTSSSIGIGALAGALVALPVSWFVAKQLAGQINS